jgi:hypothetical protein
MPNNEETDEEGGSGTPGETPRVRVCQWVTSEDGNLLEVSVFIVNRETQTVEHVETLKREGEAEGEDASGAYALLEEEAQKTLRDEVFAPYDFIEDAAEFRMDCWWCKPLHSLEDREEAERN